MPIDLQLDEANHMWLLSVGERFTLEEIAKLVSETDWKQARRFLWDLRQLREGPSSNTEVIDAAQLIENTKALWRGSFVAILVERNVDFGVARMFQVYVDEAGVVYEIFKSREQALTWLSRCSEA